LYKPDSTNFAFEQKFCLLLSHPYGKAGRCLFSALLASVTNVEVLPVPWTYTLCLNLIVSIKRCRQVWKEEL